jgi:hypothetical protein
MIEETYLNIKEKLLLDMSVEEFNAWKYLDCFGNKSQHVQFTEDLKRELEKIERYDLLINLRDSQNYKMIVINKFEKLKEKFEDKGELDAFHWLVLSPPPFEYGKTFGTREEQIKTYRKIIESVYGEGWDEMSTYIDYQKHR